MLTLRQRPVFVAVAIVAVVWLLAIVGYGIAKNMKVTPEKVTAYASSVDFSHLSAADRALAIKKLADMLNALTLEERQRLQADRIAYAWFPAMTEDEKSQFLEATMPTGFKQMIGAFEELPEDKRRKTIDNALKNLRESRARMAANSNQSTNGTNQVVLSPELREKVTKIGLQSFYSESSPQTKAELAPLLEEMQKSMQSGMLLHGGPHQ